MRKYISKLTLIVVVCWPWSLATWASPQDWGHNMGPGFSTGERLKEKMRVLRVGAAGVFFALFFL